jgi:cell division protease FtsH
MKKGRKRKEKGSKRKERFPSKARPTRPGRAAEWLFFGHLSTGAADDLAKVTDIARDMVMRFGMDKTLGPVSYESPRSPFLVGPPQAGPWSERRFSDETAHLIDEVVRRLIEQTFECVLSILKSHWELMEQRREAVAREGDAGGCGSTRDRA